MMKAWCNNIEKGKLEYVDLLEPVVEEPDDVKIRVCYATMGQEDMRIAKADNFYARGGVIAIEMAGRIVDLGEQAKADGFAVGDAVTGLPFRFCKTCRACRGGRSNCCINPSFAGGTMCEYIVWKSSQLVKLSSKTSMLEGSLVASVAEGLEVMERGNIGVKKSVAIWGGNYMSLMILQLSKRFGAFEVTLIDDVYEREGVEYSMGADHVLHPQEDDFDLDMHRITDFSGFDVMIECSGLSGSLNRSLGYLSYGGTIVLTTTYDKVISMTMNPQMVYSGNYTVTSVMMSNIKLDIAEQLAHTLRLRELISLEIPFDSIPSVFDVYDYRKHYKVAIRVHQ